MASYQFFNHSNNNRVRNSHSGEDIRARSTTQMCLLKILHIISTSPPPETPKAPSLSPMFDLLEPNVKGLTGEDNRGFFDVDLNLQLGPLPPFPLEREQQSDSPAENGGPSTCSGGVPDIDSPVVCTGASAAEKSSLGGCDLREAVNLFGSETPEIVHVEDKVIEIQRFKINNNGAFRQNTDEEESEIEVEEEKHQVKDFPSAGRLDLLIEAVKFISGEFEDSESEPEKTSPNHELSSEFCREETRKVTETEAATKEYSIRRGSKRRKQSESWMVDLYGDFEDVSPVVRSKRGRSQVLPYKYRDSVLEPWKPLSRHRSATASTKRRST